MTAQEAVAAEELLAQLVTLGASLEARGFRAKAVTGRQPPRLQVTHRQVAHLSETIYAGRARDGGTWFWWSWGERIGTINETQKVAALIARVLS